MIRDARYLLGNLEEIICGFFLVAMVSLVILNVLLRFIFSYSISWAEEVSTVCFVWSVFIGASAVYKHKMDVGIIQRLPARGQSYVRLLVSILLLLINGYIFYMSVVFTVIAWSKPTAVLGVSSAIFNSALIVGFGLITFHTLRFIREDFKAISDRGE
jgi:TRAP-type C4-dicarboxylate transport system permease small subunit